MNKEEAKFIAEGFRNIGVALAAGGIIAAAVSTPIEGSLLALLGVTEFWFSLVMLRSFNK